ncbi:MAG: MBL fold metallo-hydrolase [Salinirussus sp.]
MTVHSDWGDWLPRAVAEAEPAGLSCWYLGCNGFVLKSSSGTVVAIDPYLGTGDPPRTVRMIPVPFDPTDLADVDAVLATHEHVDHVHGPSQAPILADTGAGFYAPAASIDKVRDEGWLEEYDVAAGQLERVEAGDAVRIGDLTVRVRPAHDPDAVDPVSYLVEHQSGTFFHAGDARAGGFGDTGARFDIDLGAVAFGSVGMIPDSETGEPTRTRWYNDENGIIEAATELQVDRLVPTHWDMWRGMTADPSALHDHARSFEYPERIEIVEIGDRIEL